MDEIINHQKRLLHWMVIFTIFQAMTLFSFWKVEKQPAYPGNLTCAQHPNFFTNLGDVFKLRQIVLVLDGFNFILCFSLVLAGIMNRFGSMSICCVVHMNVTFYGLLSFYRCCFLLAFLSHWNQLTDVLFFAIDERRTLCPDIPYWVRFNLNLVVTFFWCYLCNWVPFFFIWKHISMLYKYCSHEAIYVNGRYVMRQRIGEEEFLDQRLRHQRDQLGNRVPPPSYNEVIEFDDMRSENVINEFIESLGEDAMMEIELNNMRDADGLTTDQPQYEQGNGSEVAETDSSEESTF